MENASRFSCLHLRLDGRIDLPAKLEQIFASLGIAHKGNRLDTAFHQLHGVFSSPKGFAKLQRPLILKGLMEEHLPHGGPGLPVGTRIDGISISGGSKATAVRAEEGIDGFVGILIVFVKNSANVSITAMLFHGFDKMVPSKSEPIAMVFSPSSSQK